MRVIVRLETPAIVAMYVKDSSRRDGLTKKYTESEYRYLVVCSVVDAFSLRSSEALMCGFYLPCSALTHVPGSCHDHINVRLG